MVPLITLPFLYLYRGPSLRQDINRIHPYYTYISKYKYIKTHPKGERKHEITILRLFFYPTKRGQGIKSRKIRKSTDLKRIFTGVRRLTSIMDVNVWTVFQ